MSWAYPPLASLSQRQGGQGGEAKGKSTSGDLSESGVSSAPMPLPMPPRPRARLLLVTIALLPLKAALSCIWDRDTLAAEVKGLPGILDTIVGNFPRNPPAFYEIRLERVTAEIAEKPDDLALYDDAGAAADRLHRGDGAVGWMQRKKAVLDRVRQSEEKTTHLYRYHANLGTFLIHRWLRAGPSPRRSPRPRRHETTSRGPSRSIPRRISGGKSTSSWRSSG